MDTPSAQNAPEAPTASKKPQVGIVRYDEFFSLRTFSLQWKKSKKGDQQTKAKRKNPVLIVRRCIDAQGQLKKTVVNIMSPRLQKILKTLHGTHVNISAVNPEVTREVLFHSRQHFQQKFLEEENSRVPDQDLIFDLEVMTELIETDYGSIAADADRLISEGRITFDLVWTLFPPGCLVYRRHPQLDQHQVMRHREAIYTSIKNVPHFSITCDIISNDGNHFGLAIIEDNITAFSGTVRIQDLDFLPLMYHPDHEKIYKDVVSRGAKFSRMDQQLFETSGRAFQDIRVALREKDIRLFTANGRVMINAKTFRLFEPNSEINLPVYQPLENHGLTDLELSICSPVFLGFCFGTKKWGGFAWENLRDVQWSDTAFDSLVLEQEKKLVIRSLIQRHSNQNNTFDDVISGKGKGLVGLLSGNPGCGKTLTAEAVAEAVRMPLYVVGAGDLGNSASDVDNELLRIFEIATQWKAVVLLDEADVFLHKRTPLALDQNSLVAIFLRHLEYYQGVLIMTTNMNENFDAAFESRIHFAMHYPDLNHDARKAIWKTFVQRTSGDQGRFNDNDYNNLASYKLNGRQIKNTLSVAAALAAEQNSPFTVRHVEIVLDNKAHWDKEFPKRASQRKQMLLLFGLVLFGLLIQWWKAPGRKVSYIQPMVALAMSFKGN
ncbi:hypothetical protein H0H87_012876, partial [Tephrocybe sp. NHM501043]